MKLRTMIYWGGLVGGSIIVTEIVSLVDAIFNETLIGGWSGWPLDFDLAGGLEGDGVFVARTFILDVVFWFIVLFVLIRFFQFFIKTIRR